MFADIAVTIVAKYSLAKLAGMLCFLHVGYCHEANSVPVDQVLQVGYVHYYAHYHRFGRGEKQLAS
ncbi:MAG: hypothetical protein WBR26_23285 [Candidatus Acidiferrum sp.]